MHLVIDISIMDCILLKQSVLQVKKISSDTSKAGKMFIIRKECTYAIEKDKTQI